MYYDPSVGEEYIRSKIAGSRVTAYERDIIRSVNVLSEFQQKGTISKSHRKPIKRELCGQIGRLMDKFLLHLESLRRSRITISDHRLYLSRFLFYLDSKQISAIEEVKEEYILSFVSTQTNNQIDSYMRNASYSLASRFLENKVSIPVISEALGHQNTSTTMSYLRIDTESMRQCALDAPAVSERFYEQKGGVFYE